MGDSELRDMEGWIAKESYRKCERPTREPKKKAEIRNDGRMENLKKKGGIKQNINMPFGRCADFEKEKLNDESLKRRCHAYLPV